MIDIPLSEVQPGDIVYRLIGGDAERPMLLQVTDVHKGLVFCGPWAFDQETGIEEDAELGWGRSFGVTGSFISKAERP